MLRENGKTKGEEEMMKDQMPTHEQAKRACCVSRNQVRYCLAVVEDATSLEQARAALRRMLAERENAVQSWQ